MNNADKIRMCTRYTTEMRDFYQGCQEEFTLTRDSAVGAMDGVLQFLSHVSEEDKTVKKLQDRIDALKQENVSLKMELEEYWHREYIKEADECLKEQMVREMKYQI